MGKISSYPPDTTPTLDDYFLTVDNTSTSNRKVLLSDLLTLFATQTNIPAGGGSPVTRQNENMFDYVQGNTGVWSADSVGVNRNASMSALTVYINGRRITVNAVSARTFTASKDTYIDVLDNLDGTGTLVYTEVTNNAASPALAANSIRIGIIVTGATTIATTGSINQGQFDKVLPIASSIAYSVTDSLGNLICSRDANRTVLGYRQVVANISNTSTVPAQVTGLTVPVIVPLGRKVKITTGGRSTFNNTLNEIVTLGIWDGVVSVGTLLKEAIFLQAVANDYKPPVSEVNITPTSASKTYNLAMQRIAAGTNNFEGSATSPAFMKVELE